MRRMPTIGLNGFQLYYEARRDGEPLLLLHGSMCIGDPTTWTRPWTFEVPLTMDPTQPVYEYACHEGNYGLINILSGARAKDRADVRAQPSR
jgi:hypothetical protein